MENPNPAGALNHLGVELSDTAAVESETAEFDSRGLETRVSTQETCCHAVQDKVYVNAPEVPIGMWEFYTVIDDDPADATNSDGVCCSTSDESDSTPCCS